MESEEKVIATPAIIGSSCVSTETCHPALSDLRQEGKKTHIQSLWFLTGPHLLKLKEFGTLVRESHNFQAEIKSLQHKGSTPCACSWGLTTPLTTERVEGCGICLVLS